ncbi:MULTISPECIES: CTB family bacteriocin [unclassified Nostoc]|uniref:CTB family bacteriocin n=1 Tax=unclassified Nostoc TaxID=2593658 RepID=UPI002AD2A69C|nr:CTB family bacteriocin [Nostoc sp. DedQUE03]MDZ7971601.1 CTB family bacteriocin [Nostoc sp. DedQUE03]MDZ8043509.1 CTB family bacteriocin [Nostoc sp. DedQUE02]
MSDNIEPVELSAEELDNFAGGAFSLVDAHNFNFSDKQTSAVIIGADGGIASFNSQETTISQQDLYEIKFTGEEFPSGIPSNLFPSS